MELPKNQKKHARTLIERALQRECERFLTETKAWMNQMNAEETPHKQYLELFDRVYQFDKHIVRTYDNMSGSRYYPTVFNLFYNDVLTEEDINLFSEDVRNELIQKKKEWKEFNKE